MYYVCIQIYFDMYLLFMIKARIRWCTCRVENILTLGKLLSLWFCFLLHSILFLISQTSYRTYKIISSYELARPIMGTIFLVIETTTVEPQSYALHSYGKLVQPDTEIEYIFGKYHQNFYKMGTGHQV